ncbi:MAG: CoxE, partial [Roseiflexaceae bacterium]
MDERLVAFVRALRGRDVRISLAESIDALRALELGGVADKQVVQAALRATLVKDAHDMAVFDELFAQYFGVDAPPPMQQPGGGLDDDAAQQFEQMLQELLDMLDELSEDDIKRLIEAMMGQGMTRRDLREMLERHDAMPDMSQGMPLSWAMREASEGIGMRQASELLQQLMEKLRQMGYDPAQIKAMEREVRDNRAT